MRCERIGDATLYLGDCRELMAEMAGFPADRSAACLITDPPYLVTSGGAGDGDKGGWMGEYANTGEIVQNCPWRTWLPLVPGVLDDPAHAYIFSNDRNLQEARAEAEAAGLKFHRLLVWDKRTAFPNRWYQQTCEFVLFMRRGLAFKINDPSSKSLVSMIQRDESGTTSAHAHPTEKPVDLIEHYIRNSTRYGGLVLDPFMGSGTTGVAALRAGRRFIGCEIGPKWFEASIRRISAAQHRPELF